VEKIHIRAQHSKRGTEKEKRREALRDRERKRERERQAKSVPVCKRETGEMRLM